MGEAYDRTGQFLSSVTGDTKAEVLKALEDRHGKDAAEIRIRSLAAEIENRGDDKTTDVVEPLEKFFAFEHLPAHLRAVSQPFGELAAHVIKTLPRNAERTVALRKLLEAKDCAVRALL